MSSVAQLAHTMQTLLTTTADDLARSSGFLHRRRKLTGACFAQALVLGWLTNAHASLGQLAQTAGTLGTPVSRQAVARRCTEAAAQFLQQLLEVALTTLVQGEPRAAALVARFGMVAILDSTTISLPPDLAGVWRGCGGTAARDGAAALKLQVRFDLVRGGLGISLHDGRASDQTAPGQHTALPVGALRLSDLGYFCTAVLRTLVADGGHFLCRPRASSLVTDERGRRWTLVALLTARCPQRFDQLVLLGGKDPLACRLLAQRVPPQVAAQRRQRVLAAAQRKGVPPPRAGVRLADWEVLVTSLPPEHLSLEEALILARVRWQIELLFKLWKSQGAIDEPQTRRPWQALCAIYAKLLAVVLTHWMVVVSGWAAADLSLVAATAVVRGQAGSLVLALRSGSQRRLQEALRVIGACVRSVCHMGSRATRPHTYQLLLTPHAIGGLS